MYKLKKPAPQVADTPNRVANVNPAFNLISPKQQIYFSYSPRGRNLYEVSVYDATTPQTLWRILFFGETIDEAKEHFNELLQFYKDSFAAYAKYEKPVSKREQKFKQILRLAESGYVDYKPVNTSIPISLPWRAGDLLS